MSWYSGQWTSNWAAFRRPSASARCADQERGVPGLRRDVVLDEQFLQGPTGLAGGYGSAPPRRVGRTAACPTWRFPQITSESQLVRATTLALVIHRRPPAHPPMLGG